MLPNTKGMKKFDGIMFREPCKICSENSVKVGALCTSTTLWSQREMGLLVLCL